ncbi:MAG TPA: phosphatase PAP2 family protein [Longimicrobium sp.]|jgi:membrane-associated phospholipid phosphatase|nr:phosphatase PAP2 family protein [Longimicrobium sp.]
MLPHPARPSLRRARAVAALVALSLSAAPLAPVPAAAQERHRPDDAVLWAGAGALLVGSALLDRTIESGVQHGGGTRLEWLSHRLNYVGRPQYAVAALGATYLGARLAHAPRTAEGAEHVAIALLASGVANGALKTIVGRERPAFTGSPDRFRPFNTKDHWQSFPSGHATVAFSLAASISEEAGRPWVTAATYGTAALVGWSRVYDHRHWASDVAGGALVGVAASRWTIHRLHSRRAAAGDSAASASVVIISPLLGGVMVTITR